MVMACGFGLCDGSDMLLFIHISKIETCETISYCSAMFITIQVKHAASFKKKKELGKILSFPSKRTFSMDLFWASFNSLSFSFLL